MKKKGSKRIPLLSEGILIAILTAIGYACAYYYDKGYKGYYLVPEEFIELNITTIVKVISLTIVISMFLFVLVDSLTIPIRQLKSINRAIAYKVDELLRSSLLLLFMFLFFELNIASILLFLIAVFGEAMILFVLPILQFRRVKGYKEKLEASISWEEETNQSPPNGLTTTILRRLGYKKLKVVFYCLFVLATIPNLSMIGNHNAAKQTEYMIIEGNPNYVVVGTYKDYAIAAELNMENKEINPNYRLIKNENFRARIYNTGKLKVAEPIELFKDK
ncbi:hypothetical protein [Paenibacillus faecalis]|uniref:hypothetical protein n=1 Tax=Paenibacillus faecalis TaxID=2079532 RepID=UPI000D114AA5|nr:hypothetical protein [Paenibacillus faecalis]